MNATTESTDTDTAADSFDVAAPALQLDKRQRAMLREMGIRVWTPLPLAATPAPVAGVAGVVPAGVQSATNSIAANDRGTGARALNDAKNEVLADSAEPAQAAAPVLPASRRPAASAAPATPPGSGALGAAASTTPQAAWLVAEPQLLYAQATGQDSSGRWLVLAESSALALQPGFNPFDADVGKLLDNMLRAARLHKAAAATLVPLVRQTAAHAPDAANAPPAGDWQATLQALVQSTRPDVVLIMGRLASQAVLQSSTAFGKLRGQVHQLHGVPAIVMQDAAFLLRTLPEKARAWDDLCLAMSLLQK